MRCQGTAADSPAKGESRLIAYRIEGKQSDVNSDIYDALFILENEIQFNKNVVVTSEITGVAATFEDHNAVNVKQLSEVIATAKLTTRGKSIITCSCLEFKHEGVKK